MQDNFEVFHGLTDGLGARGLLHGLQNIIELVKNCPVVVQEREFSPLREDDYLRHYRKLPHRHYNSRPAIAIQGEFLPFDQMAVLQGTIEVSELKTECRKVGGQHHQISGGGASLGDHPDGDGWENAETSGGAQSSGEPTEFF